LLSPFVPHAQLVGPAGQVVGVDYDPANNHQLRFDAADCTSGQS
jgi:hypothetical protein